MKYKLLLLLSLACTMASAQSFSFKQLRFDEDYSNLRMDTDSSWYHHFKFRPLSKNGSVFLSLGGEVRSQYFHYKDKDWGESPADQDGFVLSRALFHGDLILVNISEPLPSCKAV